MGDTVEIYLGYSGPAQRLAHRVAEALDLVGYFCSGEGCLLPVDGRPLIGVDGWGQLALDGTDRNLDAGAEPDEETTAYAPYGFELSLDFRGPREQLGQVIFERLAGLGLPMAYGDYLQIRADFRPGRGVRQFPPDTPADEQGRPVWSDLPSVGDAVSSGERLLPGDPTTGGRVVVFDASTLLQIIPLVDEDGRWRWSGPVASVLGTVSDNDLGLLLDAALHPRVGSGHVGREVIDSAASASRLSVEDLLQSRGSVEVRAESGEVVVVGCGPRSDIGDAAGPVIDGLVDSLSVSAPPEALGRMVREVFNQLTARFGPAGRE
ncbi:hypothetical protein ACIBF5_19585 [Micromonospora sp. NPDC050417]|uniref:hypothetical protein n=1 Tax=Micromonospora sp. NPDC050417 TaxID=3364280 RepID=UPI0037A7D5EC